MSLEKLGDIYSITNNITDSSITGNGTTEPLGVDDNSFPVYNEKCLFSSTYSCQTGTLADDFTKYQRLRLRVGWHNNSTTVNEGDSYIEVSPEPAAGSNVAAIWNVGTGTPGYICVGRINFPTTTSFNGTVGKLMQFDGNAGNTGWEGKLRPIKEVWGINKLMYNFYGLDSEGGSVQSNKTYGYRGDTATLIPIPYSDDWKCSSFNITGATLTGNDFMFTNSNVSAQAEFEHNKTLTLINGDHGVLSADKDKGFIGDVVTITGTMDEGWYLAGFNTTGATMTGNKFAFAGEDVTVEGLYTDEGFPVVYEADNGVHLTGDTEIAIPGQGVTLTTSYDTYYRTNGYDITGGYIENGMLYATAACTARLKSKLNAFTATGGFEKGSNVTVSNPASRKYKTGSYAGYATRNASTGDIPASWYSTSNRWNPSNASAYKITLNPKGHILLKSGNNAGNALTGKWATLIGSTYTNTAQNTLAGANRSSNSDYNKTITSNSQTTYRLSAFLNTYANSQAAGILTAQYVAANTSGTWTATGIAP